MAINHIIANPRTGTSITCTAWTGYIPRIRHMGEVYHTLGRTGVGSQSIGKRGTATRCTAMVVCADAAAAVTLEESFNDLALETTVNITDGLGQARRCCVSDVTAVTLTGAFGYAGTRYPYCVEAVMVIEDVGPAESIDTSTVP